jgi:hypothetical protein
MLRLDGLVVHHLRQRLDARTLHAVVEGFGADAVLLRLGQGSGEALQHLGVDAAALVVAGLDQLFLAGESHQRLFRLLQLGLHLLQAVLQEGLGVGGGVQPPRQIEVDEHGRDRIRHLGRQPGVGAVEVQPQQARIAHRLDRQSALHRAHHAAGLGADVRVTSVGLRGALVLLQPRQPGFHQRGLGRLVERRMLGEVEFVHHALGGGAAFQHLLLGAHVLGAVPAGLRARRHLLVLQDLGLLGIDLQQGAGAVDRSGQIGGGHHRHHHDGEEGQHRPLAPHDDGPVGAQVDRVLVLLVGHPVLHHLGAERGLAALDQGAGAARGGRPRPGAGIRQQSPWRIKVGSGGRLQPGRAGAAGRVPQRTGYCWAIRTARRRPRYRAGTRPGCAFSRGFRNSPRR